MIGGEQRAWRIRAARELKGYRTPQSLSAAMKAANFRSGYASSTIRAWEDPANSQVLDDQKLGPIAKVCGLPVEFFYVDFNRLDLSDPATRFEQELQEGADTSRRPSGGTERGERDRREEDR